MLLSSSKRVLHTIVSRTRVSETAVRPDLVLRLRLRTSSLRLCSVRSICCSSSGRSAHTSHLMDADDVCKVSELRENEPKEVQFRGEKILVVKHENNVFAVGSKCSHYGLSLTKGVVVNNTIRCPFHGACFSLRTGDLEDFPGIDRIPCYNVKVVGENVQVGLKNDETRGSTGGTRDARREERVLVVGGGVSAFQFVHTLRNNGFDGTMTLVTEEDYPYDRTKLSKVMSSKLDDILLRKPDFYEQHGIRVLNGVRADRVDVKNRIVRCANSTELLFDKLFIGTGSRARRPLIPGVDLDNIFTLRTLADANRILESAKGKHVVILGTSFIGMEVAAALKLGASSVSVVGQSSVPFQHILGREIGQAVKELFESKGITFHMNTTIREFRGSGGNVSHAVLSNGNSLDAEICVLGLGSVPDTSMLESTDILRDERGYIVTNEQMQTSVPGIYAGGDVASFLLDGKRVTIGHWQMGQSHGRVAALSLLGKDVKLHAVPYFWSAFFGKGLRFAGHVQDPENVLLDGDVKNFKFVAYYFEDGYVSAVATFDRMQIPALFASISKNGIRLEEQSVRQDPEAWIRMHQKIE